MPDDLTGFREELQKIAATCPPEHDTVMRWAVAIADLAKRVEGVDASTLALVLYPYLRKAADEIAQVKWSAAWKEQQDKEWRDRTARLAAALKAWDDFPGLPGATQHERRLAP